MKKHIPIAAILLLSACSLLMPQSMRDIVTTVDGFTLDRVTVHEKTLNLSTVLGGNKRIFVEFGADSTLTAEFSRFEDRLMVETVSFGSLRGAIGAFTLTELSAAYPIDIGYLGRRNDDTIQTVRGQFIITVKAKNAAGMSAAEELTRGLAKRISVSGLEPDIYATLPATYRVNDSENFFMGSQTFKYTFPGASSEELSISRAREGWAASYKPDESVSDVTFYKIRFPGAALAKDALNGYLRIYDDQPVIMPRESLQYYTIIEEDRRESYIANYADWLYYMPSCPPEGKARDFFEYILRGGK